MRNLYLIKRRPPPYVIQVSFHPVIIYDLLRIAKSEALWSWYTRAMILRSSTSWMRSRMMDYSDSETTRRKEKNTTMIPGDEDLTEEEIARFAKELALMEQERQDRHRQKVAEARRAIRPVRPRPIDVRPQFYRKIP